MAKVRAFFTTSDLFVGKLITWGLEEPVSHCGLCLYFDDGSAVVVHSAFHGLEIVPVEEFLAKRTLRYIADTPLQPATVLSRLARTYAFPYDFGAFVYWTIRTAATRLFGAPKIKRNVWGKSHAFLCSEYLGVELGLDQSNGILSPYEVLICLESLGYSITHLMPDIT